MGTAVLSHEGLEAKGQSRQQHHCAGCLSRQRPCAPHLCQQTLLCTAVPPASGIQDEVLTVRYFKALRAREYCLYVCWKVLSLALFCKTLRGRSCT